MSNYFQYFKFNIFKLFPVVLLFLITSICFTVQANKDINSTSSKAPVSHTSTVEENDIDIKNLEGEKIIFDYKNHLEERKVALQFFLDRFKDNEVFSKTQIEEIGIYLYDIDNDGTIEIFAYINGGNKCPRAGCPFAAIRKISPEINVRGYEEIKWFTKSGSTLGHWPSLSIRILNNTTLGYHDILFGDESNTIDKINFQISLWKWNGTYYDIYKVF